MTPAEAFISFLGMALVQIAIGARGPRGGGGVGESLGLARRGETRRAAASLESAMSLLQYNITHKP